jgi:two-component system, OmpR family, sensor histidine kinase VicK
MVFPGNEISEPEKTEILIGNDNIIKKTLETFSWIEESLDGSIDKDGPALNVLYEPIWTGYISLKKRGIKLRGVTEVTVDNIQYCKKLMEVSGLRHLDGVRTNFAIADRKAVMLHGISQEADPLSHAIVTSVKGIVDAQQYMFENLWNKAIPAEQKIREIEQGIKPDIIETITDPIRIQNLYLSLIRSALTEIMLIIPTANAIYRQIKIGILHLLKEVTANHSNNSNFDMNIRILTSSINDYHVAEEQKIKILLSSFHTQIRNIETDSTTKSTIIIIDRKESLVIELKDDSKDTFSESIGFATYSNSRATVLSYTSIFESFWKQSDLVKKLKESEELQKDFVHIAAHELKNPIQPILGLSSILMKHKPSDENEFHNIVKTINRNAKKLIQLTNDILDVTKIETNNLNLNKELLNLGDLIYDIIEDYNNQLDNKNVRLTSKFIYSNKFDEKKGEEYKYDISVFADRTRINQVISNLLDNAIKFTDKGFIDIIIEKKYTENKVNISVKDTGCGIDQIILPKLFSKFATKSKGGTGLGLYISKNIIETHGGQIYANNNKDGKGSTFGFSLPLIK